MRHLLLKKVLPFYGRVASFSRRILSLASRQAEYLDRVRLVSIGTTTEAIQSYERAVDVLMKLSKTHAKYEFGVARACNILGDLYRS